ncbi:MAG TPA: 16S rRNA processing protein RimM, partial [Roseiarcus sp.]|nr:16S rRNA processing protein RimM [Roseiarcus sp.]
MPSAKRLVLLGVFGAAQGVRGEVRVKSYTADPKAIGAYGALTD